jgi:hypothetical protein
MHGKKTSTSYSRNNSWEHLKGVKNTHNPLIGRAFVIEPPLLYLKFYFFFPSFFLLPFFSQAKTTSSSSGGAIATIAKNSSF